MDPYTTLFQSTLLWLKRSTGYTNTGEVFHSTKHITSYFTSIQIKLVVKFLHFVCHCGVISPAARAWHIICQRALKIWPQLNLSTVCWDTLYFYSFSENNSCLSKCCRGTSHKVSLGFAIPFYPEPLFSHKLKTTPPQWLILAYFNYGKMYQTIIFDNDHILVVTFQKDQKLWFFSTKRSTRYSLNLQCINASAYQFLAPILKQPSNALTSS